MARFPLGLFPKVLIMMTLPLVCMKMSIQGQCGKFLKKKKPTFVTGKIIPNFEILPFLFMVKIFLLGRHGS